MNRLLIVRNLYPFDVPYPWPWVPWSVCRWHQHIQFQYKIISDFPHKTCIVLGLLSPLTILWWKTLSGVFQVALPIIIALWNQLTSVGNSGLRKRLNLSYYWDTTEYADLTPLVSPKDMVESPIKHKKPVMGLLDRPYRETGTRGFALYPWRAFCIPP